MTCSEDLSGTGSESGDAGDDNSGDEDVSNGDLNGDSMGIPEDNSETDVTIDKPKKPAKKSKTVILPTRKIGPQKQKKEIHTYLKKAKKFEIRKLTRRITTLRNLKGTDEQKAKNNRKVEKLLQEIQAMREFMIDQLTERVVNIFKTKGEQIYLDIWNAAQDHKDFEKMLQTLSNGDDSNKYENIAFLRMLSSKDILCKLKMICSGTNIKKQKSKKALQKQRRKYNQKTKKLRKIGIDGPADKTKLTKETTDDIAMETTDNQVEPTKNLKSEKKEKSKVKKQKKSKQVVDSFFLPADKTASHNDDTSSDEEFSAPVDEAQVVVAKKKNRMGQRRRKMLVERSHVKTMTEKSKGRQGSRPRQSSNVHKRTKLLGISKKDIINDEKLHPSWKAKQKLKSQQGITEFSGTKITFDDD